MSPRLPQGTRDFAPAVLAKRQYILRTIQSIFELYGYAPIETPAMELLETLMGKYGDEGDKLIFKILNNGLNDPNKKEKTTAAFNHILEGKNDVLITERALRYDLTIPLARFVVMNQNDLAFPFKRYQMQPVWRADRPQKGRYREFWQCDADVIGSNALLHEAELLRIYAQAFAQLGIPGIAIKVNNRKILAGLAEVINATEQLTALTVIIDKLDKIGMDKVSEELMKIGMNAAQIQVINQVFALEGSNTAKLDALTDILINSDTGLKGINELKTILAYYAQLVGGDATDAVTLDFTLARGLNYYTGMIVEVTTDAVSMGSIGGGGRYDDLTGLFGLKNMSGVGISFGIDRIYDVMEELTLFPSDIGTITKIILLSMDEQAEAIILEYLHTLRTHHIPAEYYADRGKLDKQMKYANKRGIPLVAIIGSTELEKGVLSVKNMTTGTQEDMSIGALVEMLK